jgi:hypothetical protein
MKRAAEGFRRAAALLLLLDDPAVAFVEYAAATACEATGMRAAAAAAEAAGEDAAAAEKAADVALDVPASCMRVFTTSAGTCRERTCIRVT